MSTITIESVLKIPGSGARKTDFFVKSFFTVFKKSVINKSLLGVFLVKIFESDGFSPDFKIIDNRSENSGIAADFTTESLQAGMIFSAADPQRGTPLSCKDRRKGIRKFHGPLAHPVEQLTLNQRAGGSSPPWPINIMTSVMIEKRGPAIAP